MQHLSFPSKLCNNICGIVFLLVLVLVFGYKSGDSLKPVTTRVA
jgi:hypothetical protein